jgi:membrane protein DedA with SNARE-associated domain
MQHLIVTYGLAAIFLLMVAESACIPVPSEVTMLLGGALAGGAVAGPHPNLIAVIAAGTLGNVVGSYLAWLVGRFGGRPAQDWFDRRGAASVFWARLLPGIRTFISLPAGIAEMPAGRFGIITLAGCLPWTAALAIAGYGVGANWHSLENALRGPSYLIAGVAVLIIAAVVVVAIRRRHRQTDVAESVARQAAGTSN